MNTLFNNQEAAIKRSSDLLKQIVSSMLGTAYLVQSFEQNKRTQAKRFGMTSISDKCTKNLVICDQMVYSRKEAYEKLV